MYFLSLIWNFLIEHLDVISLLLALFSIWLSYWFWKNPIDTNFNKLTKIDDPSSGFIYQTGKNHKGWVVQKTDTSALEAGTKYKFIATQKNNPNVKKAPESLEEIKKLNFS